MKTKSAEGWGIVKNGRVLVDTIHPIRFGKKFCIEEFMFLYEIQGTWAEAERSGYKCVRVKVEANA